MSERERWVVYPLLFLALGVSLRDKLGGQLTAKKIVCQELRIEDEPKGNQPPAPLAILQRVPATGNHPAFASLRVDGIVDVSQYYAIKGFPISIFQIAPREASLIRPAPQTAPPTTPLNQKTSRSTDDSTKNPPPADKSDPATAPQN